MRLGKTRCPLLLLLVSLAASGCFGTHLVRSELSSRVPRRTFTGVTEHVILISVDGLRPDAIGKFDAATLRRLMHEGSYTLSATTILPSKTLPSHTSMLTGQPPGVHGVSWNTKLGADSRHPHAPTVFGILRAEGFVTAAFFSKAKFSTLQLPGTLDYSESPGGWWGYRPASRTAKDVERYLSVERPNLLFVHFGDADRAGHAFGWMSAKYGEAVHSIDTAIAQLLTTAEQTFGATNFTVIVTADHGGHNRDHGSSDPRDVTIPWIAWGKGVTAGPINRPIRTMDTASTIRWALGAAEPGAFDGKPVKEAF